MQVIDPLGGATVKFNLTIRWEFAMPCRLREFVAGDPAMQRVLTNLARTHGTEALFATLAGYRLGADPRVKLRRLAAKTHDPRAKLDYLAARAAPRPSVASRRTNRGDPRVALSRLRRHHPEFRGDLVPFPSRIDPSTGDYADDWTRLCGACGLDVDYGASQCVCGAWVPEDAIASRSASHRNPAIAKLELRAHRHASGW